MASYTFENMSEEHRESVTEIFNHYIINSMAAYPHEPVSKMFFDRFLDMTHGHPALVIIDETGWTVGFAFFHPYRPDPSFRHTAEITCFILPDHTGKGLGTTVLKKLSLMGRKQGIKILLANISSLNPGSIHFHLKNGFRECGRFRGIGKKFDHVFDVVWMQKDLG
jgi:phosphinothricin acetyltransferase